VTAPHRDGRPLIDRAREMRRKGAYFVHEQCGDAHDVICWLLDELGRCNGRFVWLRNVLLERLRRDRYDVNEYAGHGRSEAEERAYKQGWNDASANAERALKDYADAPIVRMRRVRRS
jgi:hypothetical protein